MMGIIWTIISYVIGALLRMMQQRNDANIETQRTLCKMAQLNVANTMDARQMQTPDTQFTRRVVMIMITACLMAVMLYGVFHGGNMVQPVVTTTQPSGFFGMLFGAGGSEVDFQSIPLTLTVAYAWDLFGIMIGFYFGSGGTRG